MSTPRWDTLGQVSPSRLVDARRLSHHAAQLVASVGRSLSPGDEEIPEPYFYVTPWPPPGAGEPLPDLPAPGRWHREGWTGAVLTGTEVVAAGDGGAQAARASAFLAEAVSALRARHEQRRP